MDLTLIKVHGSENDFYLLDETLLPRALSEAEIKKIAVQICHRQSGLLGGADGLLLVTQSQSKKDLAKMRVINADGSEASMCGNGLRTVARYLSEKSGEKSFSVETLQTSLQVKQAEEIGKGVPTYQVEISPVHFDASALPMHIGVETCIHQELPELMAQLQIFEPLKFSAVAVPNPHLITFVSKDLLEGPIQKRLATYLNGENPYFPDGVNVSFVEVLGSNRIFVKTYERGVGFTNACGTAMSASALMYVLLQGGRLETTIDVLNPGGMVQVQAHRNHGEYGMDLIGNATFCYTVKSNLEDLLEEKFESVEVAYFNEEADYQRFVEQIQL